jgi:DUF1680 family protein
MANTNRRKFIQASAATAASVALNPLSPLAEAGAETAATATSAAAAAAANDRVRAVPVPLNRVRLTGGPLKVWQDADAKYLLSLEPDRMMAFYRERAGLTKKAEPYAGWDGAGRNLTGHIAGHHLSAVSLMYLATGDERFKQRADYLVKEMKEVQDKNGDGYCGAIEGAKQNFAALSRGEIRGAAFDLNGMWSPFYTLHKTFAGLRDAYRHTGNKTALHIETKFAGWVEKTIAPLNDLQIAKMLNTEHGGMNEVLADLYVDTKDDRWLALSRRFEHHAFTDALKRHQDVLPGKHGNCQIPKLIGSAARYEYTGDADDLIAATFFWDRVAQHHSYATGGHGLAEYFGFPDEFANRLDGRTCETCNVYNMLKLTRRLFSFRPDAEYADFHEKALFNHILASMDPEGAKMSYMVPVGRATQQEYQNMLQSFTCCVGTGMESHALHGDGIYYESPDTVWVNLFVPSTAELRDGLKISQDSSFPDGDSAKLTIASGRSKPFTLAVRRPGWAGDGFAVRVNGQPIEVPKVASLRVGGAGGRDMGFDDPSLPPSSYVDITREWKTGDVVEISIPKSLRLDLVPDDTTVAAIMWGPLVMAGNLGPRRQGPGRAEVVAPALVSDKPVTEWVVSAGMPGDFKASGVAKSWAEPSASGGDVSLTPFYRTHEKTYSVYFDVLTPTEFEGKVAARAAEAEHQKRIEAASVGYVQPGDTNAEQTFGYKSEPADRQAARANNRTSRGGSGWFSYDLPVDGSTANALIVTYYNDLALPVLSNYEILIDGTRVAKYSPNHTAGGFWNATYAVPASLTSGKSKVTVRLQATGNDRIPPVYGIRMVRASAVSG